MLRGRFPEQAPTRCHAQEVDRATQRLFTCVVTWGVLEYRQRYVGTSWLATDSYMRDIVVGAHWDANPPSYTPSGYSSKKTYRASWTSWWFFVVLSISTRYMKSNSEIAEILIFCRKQKRILFMLIHVFYLFTMGFTWSRDILPHTWWGFAW